MWIVQSEAGSVKGPFEFDQMVRMLTEGQLEAENLVSEFPREDWRPLAQIPEFSELIFNLMSQVSSGVEGKAEEAKLVETIFMPVPEEALRKKKPQAKEKIYLDQPREIVQSQLEIGTVRSPRHESEVVQLQLNEKPREEERSPIKTAIAASLFALVAGLVYLALEDDSTVIQSGSRIRLVGPTSRKNAMQPSEVQEKFRVALGGVEGDTVEGYLRAQNILVSLVESLPNNLNVRGLLCVVYHELWPHSFQDSQDQKVIASMAQGTRSLNYLDANGLVCEAVKLLALGKYKEARSVVDGSLEIRETFSLMGALHHLKGEILEGEKNYLDAFSYFESARGLWPNWLKIPLLMARVKIRMNEPVPAAQYLRLVLQKNPKHKEALIMMGALEYRSFRQSQNAMAYLQSAIKSELRATKSAEAEAYWIMAEIALEKADRRKARGFAEKAFELNPSQPKIKELLLRLGGKPGGKPAVAQGDTLVVGDQYMRQGDYLTAQSEFKAAFEANPKLAVAALKAAKCLWQLNQTFEAIQWLKKATDSDPKLIAAYVLRADYLTQRFDFSGAISALQQAQKIAPNNHEVFKGLALLEYRKGNLRAAITYGKRALALYDGDVETYVVLSNASSSYSENLMPTNKADLIKKDELKRESIRFASHAIEIDSTNVEAQITYAKRISQQSGVDAGISYLRDLANRFSFSHEYKIAVAELLKGEERYSQAIEFYQQVTELDPRNKKAFIGMGECFTAMGQPDSALKAYLNAAIIDPSEGDALFQAGKLYYETNRNDEAIENFRRVLRVNPNFPRVHYYIGKAGFAKGDIDLTTESIKKEKKQNPNLADPYILMAEVMTLKKQYGACASEYAVALKLRPHGAEIYVKAAQCYRLAGSLDIAEDMLALAATKESGYADIYREQGLIFETKGDFRSAGQAYNKYLGLSPNALDRIEIEAKLLKIGE